MLILFAALVLLLAVVPQMWVSGVMRRHAKERADLPGTGGEFARHVLDAMKLGHVRVEETAHGDHYDPAGKAVRLTPQNMRGRSLTAVVVAAHEVGHAMQDATGYAPLQARTRLAEQARKIERAGAVVMLASPLVMLLARAPQLMLVGLFIGMLMLALVVLINALALPVEFDASFRRALPVLKTGRYIRPEDMPAARAILRAAACTYVAAAATSLLDVLRWVRALRI
jgi:Zn-dependent membrane protease YugP